MDWFELESLLSLNPEPFYLFIYKSSFPLFGYPFFLKNIFQSVMEEEVEDGGIRGGGAI